MYKFYIIFTQNIYIVIMINNAKPTQPLLRVDPAY